MITIDELSAKTNQPASLQLQPLLQKIAELERRIVLYEMLEDKIEALMRTLEFREGDFARLKSWSASVLVNGQGVTLQGPAIRLEGSNQISLVCGDASIVLKKDGTINIKGGDIVVNGSKDVSIKGTKDVTIKGKKILEN